MDTNRHEWNSVGRARHSVRAALDWWGEATDELAREDAHPTNGAHGVTRPTFLFRVHACPYVVTPFK